MIAVRPNSLPIYLAAAAFSLSATQVVSLADSPVPTGVTERASCVLMIEDRSNTGRSADHQLLSATLTSTALVDATMKEAVDLAPAEWPKVASIDLSPVGQRGVKLTVSLNPARVPAGKSLPAGAAQKILDLLATKTKTAIESVGREREADLAKQRETLTTRRAAVETRLRELEQERPAIQRQIRALQIEVNRSSSMTGGRDPAVANSREQLQAILRLRENRLTALQRARARLESDPTTLPADSPQAAVTDLVAARQKILDRLREAMSIGQAGDLDVARAEADLAEARIRAAELFAPKRTAAFDQRFAAEIIELSVEIETLQLQIAQLPPANDAAAATTQPASSPADTLDQLTVKQGELHGEQSRLQNELSRINGELDQLRRSEDQATRVFIIDGAK